MEAAPPSGTRLREVAGPCSILVRRNQPGKENGSRPRRRLRGQRSGGGALRGRKLLAIFLVASGCLDVAGSSSCLVPRGGSPGPFGAQGNAGGSEGRGPSNSAQGVSAGQLPGSFKEGGEPASAVVKATGGPPQRSFFAWVLRSTLCCFGGFLSDGLSSHKLWEQLDKQDELQRLRLALSTLSEVAAEKQMMEGEDQSKADMFEIKGIDSGGEHFPEEISLASIQAMFDTFHTQRQRLHVDSFKNILSKVEPVLSELPNVVTIPSNETVTVVGDLHGSLSDLDRIFQLRGWPAKDNVFIFNGDFVDRGDKGVEVVATLFALKIALPDYVHLNRGNHEDEHIGRAYGFFDEVMSKYGSISLYDRIQDVFALLPLCTIIKDVAFVVHAGISRLRGTTVSHIGAVERAKLRTTVKVATDAKSGGGWKPSSRSLYLLEDLLWSDPSHPVLEPGSERNLSPNNSRGAGTKFGSAMTKEWLKKNGLTTLVRSHQCLPKGWDVIDCGEGTSCWTVFSASDYGSGGNDGAVLVFDGGDPPTPRIVQYEASRDSMCLRSRNRQRLIDLICGYKAELRLEFKRIAGKRQMIRVGEWDKALQRVLRLKVDFRPLRLELVGLPDSPRKSDEIDWAAFLERYQIEVKIPGGGGSEVLKPNERLSIEAIFKNRRELAVVFRLLDLNGDGKLGQDEVKKACGMLNKNLPEGRKIDAEDLFSIMDANEDGAVSVDDFCECWRQAQ